jgi:hypothetical protein
VSLQSIVFIRCSRRNCQLAYCGQSSKTSRIPVTVLQEVYTAGGSVTYGRDNTNYVFDVNQTRALIDNYVRQHHSAHFVGAVRRTDLHGCTTGFTCRSFTCCAYSRLKLTDTGQSYYIHICPDSSVSGNNISCRHIMWLVTPHEMCATTEM